MPNVSCRRFCTLRETGFAHAGARNLNEEEARNTSNRELPKSANKVVTPGGPTYNEYNQGMQYSPNSNPIPIQPGRQINFN